MPDELSKLDFQIAFGAVKHFGRNLYTTNPPAIAELVANAWDAYANECKIFFNNNDLLIFDDGIGMTDEELQERYAKSGYMKDLDVRIPDGFTKRPYMGKKGIGKFSAFSLADKYVLYTKSDADTNWKVIELQHDMLDTKEPTVTIPIKRVDNLNEIEIKFGFFAKIGVTTGTVIYLPNLKKKITETTVASLKALLPQRFSVTTIVNDGKFKLFLQDGELDLKKHFYYDSIELVHCFGYTKEEIKHFFANIHDNNIKIVEHPWRNAKGWIATVELPTNLKTNEGVKVKGVVIYINGKLADEDIFKNYPSDMYANAYVIGEVNADFLDDIGIDPVLSSREGLNHEVAEIIELREYLKKIRTNILIYWGEFRALRPVDQQEYLQKALSSSGLQKTYDRLPVTEQNKINKYAQRLFDRPRETASEDEKSLAMANVILPAVFQMVNKEALQELLEKTGLTSEEILQAFAEIFNFSEINHAIRLRSNVEEKLQIVKKLQEYRGSGEVEKVFENHLAKHPWLIEPYWIAQPKNVKTQDYYVLCGINNEDETKQYIDIIIDIAGELNPIIVEIKREKATPYSTPDHRAIVNQISKYREAIADNLKKQPGRASLRELDIQAYFICGDTALSRISLDGRQYLETNKIQIKSYDTLIRQAEAIYSANFGLDDIL